MKEYEVPKAGNINFWVDKDNKLMAVDSDGNDLLADIDPDHNVVVLVDRAKETITQVFGLPEEMLRSMNEKA